MFERINKEKKGKIRAVTEPSYARAARRSAR